MSDHDDEEYPEMMEPDPLQHPDVVEAFATLRAERDERRARCVQLGMEVDDLVSEKRGAVARAEAAEARVAELEALTRLSFEGAFESLHEQLAEANDEIEALRARAHCVGCGDPSCEDCEGAEMVQRMQCNAMAELRARAERAESALAEMTARCEAMRRRADNRDAIAQHDLSIALRKHAGEEG